MGLVVLIEFNGQCRGDAFSCYESLLDARVGTMLVFGDSPMAASVPGSWQDRILHGNIMIQDTEVAGFDALPDQYQPPTGFTLIYGTTDPEQRHRVFEGLAEQGNVVLPLQETFWSPCHGIVTDRFGVPWKILCRQA